jgi:hypothetical protein
MRQCFKALRMQVAQLCDLSVLQLYLVVAMARLEGKGQQTYNFEVRERAHGWMMWVVVCAGE